MKQALRGVNLGGWLVIEYWMSPGLFDGVQGRDELSLVRELGFVEATRRLTKHRNAFITKADIKTIRDYGFDFVRLPVGYWLFEKTDNFVDGEGYVDKLFAWAEEYGLGVILDFHGLQGSQNGKDHSGAIGAVRAYRPSNRRQAIATTLYMARKYGQQPALLGLEIMNEPRQRFFLRRLLHYYDDVIPQVRTVLPRHIKIIVSDAFWPRRMARALARRQYEGIVLDVHLYQNHPPPWRRYLDQFLTHVEDRWRPLLTSLSASCDVIVGEWSAALPTDILKQARSQQHGERQYFHAQQAVYDETSWAHSYWSYRAPHNGPWDYAWARTWLEPDS